MWWFLLTPTQMKQLFLALLLLGRISASAQDSTGFGPEVKLGLFYNSNLNYYGRTDSLQSAATFLQLELWLTKGFYVSATPILVHNRVQRATYAGTTATVGYQHLTERWLTNAYVLKPFYRDGTDLAQSVLKLGSGATVSHLNKIVNITVGGDLRWSNNLEVGATAGLDHLVRVSAGKGTVLVIDPSLYAYAGTQRIIGGKSRKGRGSLPAPPDARQTEERTRFALLAYEAALPLIFVRGKALLMATPSYIAPQNLVQVPGRPDLSETGERSFSLTLGVKYTF